MAHIHGRGFIHRDVKPHNVLLNKSNDALICDLGTVKNLDPDGIGSDNVDPKMVEEEYDLEAPASSAMTQNLGTPLYMAPEQMLCDTYTNAVDVWAYGIMMVRLFSLGDPYHSNITMRELKEEVTRNRMKPNRLKASSLPHPRIKTIIEGCLEFVPEDRYTFEQIEESLSTVLNEIEINIQTKRKLLEFLKTFVIEDNQHIKKDLGSYYDKFLEQGVECQEDLGLITREDLMNMGLNKISAKKTIRKFVDIAKVEEKKRKELERKAALTYTMKKNKKGPIEKNTKTTNSIDSSIMKKSSDPLTTSLNRSKNSSDSYDRDETKQEFTILPVQPALKPKKTNKTSLDQPGQDLFAYLKTFKKVDHRQNDLGFYYQRFLDEGVEKIADLEDVTWEDLLDMGLKEANAKNIGKTFAEITKIRADDEDKKSPQHHTRTSTQLPPNWHKYDDDKGNKYYSNGKDASWVPPEGSTGGSAGVGGSAGGNTDGNTDGNADGNADEHVGGTTAKKPKRKSKKKTPKMPDLSMTMPPVKKVKNKSKKAPTNAKVDLSMTTMPPKKKKKKKNKK